MPADDLRCAEWSSDGEGEAWVWTHIKAKAHRDAELELALASYLYSTILSHSSLERSLSFHLGNKLYSSTLISTLLYDLFLNTFSSDPSLRAAAVADLCAAHERDPAWVSFSHCLLNYKGFLACQVHRVGHKLWIQNRRPLALALHSRIADVFAVDIPGGEDRKWGAVQPRDRGGGGGDGDDRKQCVDTPPRDAGRDREGRRR